eukprot:comp21686_c1_seq1/m.30556 comp21686_c1_seq1/g.30556  ORF comp21686_c1_seq1/g.30556 comp21686_c1_seq1/m.30556 type:complete len:480 (-) comp21686_c1_seq1:763-2202(-)
MTAGDGTRRGYGTGLEDSNGFINVDNSNSSRESLADVESALLESQPLLSNGKAKKAVLGGHGGHKESNEAEVEETGWMGLVRLLCQVMPFSFLAGIGLVCSGIVLDKVQRWDVFQKYDVLFVLVPALLGLKGNLEMTLSSRLSTFASLGYFSCGNRKWLILANLALVQVQALVVGTLAALYACGVSAVSNEQITWHEANVVLSSSLTAASGSSGVLSSIMMAIVFIAPMLGVDPDNISTPIAATLGDLVTLTFLALTSSSVHAHIETSPWVAPLVSVLLLCTLPMWLWLARSHPTTTPVLRDGWTPIITAMLISSAGGMILQRFADQFPNLAIYDPVLNGVGGNIAAVHCSRVSTTLHLKMAESTESLRAVSKQHRQSAAAFWIMGTVLHCIFLTAIEVVHGTIGTLTLVFVAVYMGVAVIQILALLIFAHLLVFYVWSKGKDPDNIVIPYVTAVGDLLGTGLLAVGFVLLDFLGAQRV